MASQQIKDESITVSLKRIGGIDTLDLDIPLGVTILAGDNATNRTSTLYGIMAALGSEHPGITVKTGYDEGEATITIGDDSFSTTVSRSGTDSIVTGDNYLDNPTPADQYAFLLRDNPIRQTIETGGDLYSILMDPVDTEAIEAKIDELRTQRKTLTSQIEDAQEAADILPKLEEKRTESANELEELKEKEAEIKAKQQEIRKQASPERKEELEQITTKRETKQEQLEQVEREIGRVENRLERAKEKYETLDVPDVDIEDLKTDRDQLEAEITALKPQRRELKQAKSKIINAQNTAQDLLQTDESLTATLTSLPRQIDIPTGPLSLTKDPSAEELTDELSAGKQLYCTACGSETNADGVQAVIDQYKELKQALTDEINSIETEIDSIEQEITDIETTITSYDNTIGEISKSEDVINDAENELKTLSEEKEKLEAKVEELHTKENKLEQEITDTEDIETIQSNLSNVQNRITNVSRTLDEINNKIDNKEAEAEREQELLDERDAIIDEYEAKVDEIDRIEKELVEQFNNNMDEILSILSYKNIARAWIERKSPSGEDTDFELHIVRETKEGVQEGRIEHLSESERAVIGLTVGLTGYLVHDIASDCPVMLLDSIEMIDSTRIKKLLEFFGTRTDYLIVALLSEDANQMPSDQFTIVET